MTEYKIERWDGVMYGNNLTPQPMIYIKPDLSFLEFVKANDYKVKVIIKETGIKLYDNFLIEGIVQTSASTPSCIPNYFNETGYYVITLLNPWMGYPNKDNLGTCTIYGENDKIITPFGLEHNIKLSENTNLTVSPAKLSPEPPFENLTTIVIVIIIVIVIVIVIVCLYFYRRNRNRGVKIK